MKALRENLKLLFSRRLMVVCAVIILIYILLAIFAPQICKYDPNRIMPAQSLTGITKDHPLGTDSLGRDQLTRIIYGTRTALLIGFASIVVGGIAGILLGTLAGYFGGWVDFVIMRITDALLAIPSIVLAMSLMLILKQNIFNIVIAVSISSLTGYIRIMRGQVLTIKQSDYIMAGKILGMKSPALIIKHLVPNCMSPIIVTATMNLGNAILTEASLSYLNVGVPAPTAAWGSMVSNGKDYIMSHPELAIAPGIAILILVLAFNLLGDGIRDVLDPRIKNNI